MVNPVAIVGGGFAGAMLAARLAELGVPSRLINRTPEFGPGLAYSTGSDAHVLNVRSARMSAVAGDPDNFVRWLDDRHPGRFDPAVFVPRRLYGDYLKARLATAEAEHPGLLERIVGEASAITDRGVRLADGRLIQAGTVVLATGNPAPAALADHGETAVIRDPWAPNALDLVQPSDRIVIVGSGLTMVDVVLALEASGWVGHATAISRRGLTPRSHDHSGAAIAPPESLIQGPLSQRLHAARALAKGHDWREVMEALRPVTAALWISATVDERARFLRHLRPWWDVHRHRIAPDVAARIARRQAEGRLEVRAGRIVGVGPSADGVSVRWRGRGERRERVLAAAWMIDCSGPGFAPGSEAPAAGLLATGAARMDPLGLGLDIDAEGRVLDVEGRPNDRLFVLGPPARAGFWETVAVPDIRERIEQLAGRLSA